MASVQNYQCPACGGPLAFNAATGKLSCPYCDSSYSPEEIAAQHEDSASGTAAGGTDAGTGDGQSAEWDTSQLNRDWGQDAVTMREYSCPSCGATIVCEQTTAATSCPYCDNPTIVETQFAGALRPDYIIPFKVKKEQAVSALSDYYHRKPLLPNEFAAQNHLEEAKGVYVPFWFFDGTASGSAVFHTTTSTTHRRGGDTVCITRHYECRRAGEIDFALVPVDASKQMDDDLMDSVEPYNYEDLQPFSTGFLPGYLADIHDVDAEECFERAYTRCAATCVQALESTVQGYESCHLSGKNIALRNGVVHYGLLPVYLLNTRCDDKKYTFAVNGQTGKVIGNLPISTAKSVGRFFTRFFIALLIEVVIGAVSLAQSGDGMPLDIGMIIEDFGMVLAGMGIAAAIIGGISVANARAKMKPVAIASEAGRYTRGDLRLSLSTDTFQYERTKVIERKQ